MIIERPILFTGEMVRAILAGKKTQTRRVIKPQPGVWSDGPLSKWMRRRLRGRCCYGIPGDRLWVRETWKHRGYDLASDRDPASLEDWRLALDDWFYIHYKATNAIKGVELPVRDCLAYTKKYAGDKWRPSIHMPRWACRIMLEVTGVRVERVQDISYDDILAEGWDVKSSQPMTDGTAGVDALLWFRVLWDTINKKRGFDWDSNPWVFVVGFRVLEP